MLGARSRLPSWPDLPTVGQKAPQHIRPLVINVGGLPLAENAIFTTLREPTFTAPLVPRTPTPPLFRQCFNLPAVSVSGTLEIHGIRALDTINY
jgi:hypothetical protein